MGGENGTSCFALARAVLVAAAIACAAGLSDDTMISSVRRFDAV
eukprot:CAMPEP_0182869510 /NCGR_PEP_ID=MMETSP0034_2-20130328/9984_1 /TAXON_ID=156128 /ORGANISM="Nephroselmis pyriformis, Strain CCMP717" /LENGTH=43 /DNA_ID= /DNA_START= /DNA_END= /DNA_ORIENTATION=